MIKLALIGEDPNDTTSICNLLRKKYADRIAFTVMLKRFRGDQLKTAKAADALRIEYKELRPGMILFIKDADALPSETAKINIVESWFKKMNTIVENKGLLLLNIYELEALILANIETFNEIYATNIAFKGNVMYQQNPKEFLKSKTYRGKKQYTESHCPSIFDKLNFEEVERKCDYFRRFIAVLNERLSLI